MTLFDAGLAARGWLGVLGMMAAHGTVLAILALVITRAGRLRPAWQAAVWLVVVAKLALPWGPAMPWSLSDLIARLTDSAPPAAPFVLTPGMTRVAETHAAWPSIGWLSLAAIWAIGASIVIARAVAAQRRTLRAARLAPLAPAGALQLLAAHAPRRTPRLVVGAAELGPHVVGLFRPIIVVPPGLFDEPALLRAALLHELAHVRRRDAFARLVQVAASALMWWLPVMRIVNRRLELAREAACDAWALETGDVSRPAYARLLVRMAALRTAAAASALAAPHSLDARVAAVLGPPARARMSHLHRLVLAGWMLLALGGARSASARGVPETCAYTPALALALYDAFPDADLDGDGTLSRAEACDLQANLRRDPEELTSRLSPEGEAQLESLLAEPLCCNCDSPEVYSGAETRTCQKAEGVER